ARRNAEFLQERSPAEVRRLPPRLTRADVDRGLANEHRHQLAVQVGDVQQRDIADAVEAQELLLGQPLLRQRAPERAEAVRRSKGWRGGPDWQNLTSRDHRFESRSLNEDDAWAPSPPSSGGEGRGEGSLRESCACGSTPPPDPLPARAGRGS